MHKPVLIAHAKKKGRIHRGGGRNYLPMKNDILRFLKQDKNPDVFFTTMIDLYAIPSDFPGLAESEKLGADPEMRVMFLESRFAVDIDDLRFIPYIQLYEFEAYLFTDPSCFGRLYDNCANEIVALEKIADAHATPEMINDGQHSAPSKRISNQFPDYGKAKAAFGPLLAESIGLANIRAECPHFAHWISRLEALGDSTKTGTQNVLGTYHLNKTWKRATH